MNRVSKIKLFSALVCLYVAVIYTPRAYADAINYQRKYKILYRSGNTAVAKDSSLVTEIFYDGLGRKIQSKSYRNGRPQKAVANFVEYDCRSRISNEWLASPVGGGGEFSPLSEVRAAHEASRGMLTAYSYEDGVMGRVTATRRPGEKRHTSGAAPIKYEYMYNVSRTSDELFCYEIFCKDGILTITGAYKAGVLNVTRITDEDGNRTFTFTDSRGRTILERKVWMGKNGSESADIRYLYDSRGRLTHVITPLGCAEFNKGKSINSLSPLGKSLCYEYRYDDMDRVNYVRVPGSGATRTVYTPSGEVAVIQDNVQWGAGECLRMVYDAEGRHLYSGLQSISEATMDSCAHVCGVQSSAISLGEIPGGINGYTPCSPLSNDRPALKDILRIDYYDDYSFLSQSAYSAIADSLSYVDMPGCDKCPSPVAGIRNKGKLTGTALRVIGGEMDGQLLLSVFYYDSRGRLIQSVAQNHLGGFVRSGMSLSFDGRVVSSRETISLPDTTLCTERKFSYTPELQLASVQLRHLPGGDWIQLSSSQYDDMGRPVSVALLGDGITCSYSYSPIGELTAMTSEAFAEQIFRETRADGSPGYLNGRISSERFRLSRTPGANGATSGGRYLAATYEYSYEGDRLSQAAYSEQGRMESREGTALADFVADNPDYSTSYSYDKDGRPISIIRHGVQDRTLGSYLSLPSIGLRPGSGVWQPGHSSFGMVDNIALTYTKGRLSRADDSGEDCSLSIATDWYEETQQDSEYSYDMCGRMTADKNRGITIAYNEIGQPSEITGASGVIRLSYLADGTVLSRRYGTDKWVTVDMGFTSYTYLDFEQSLRRDYVGALSLEDGSIEKFRHEAGWTDSKGREVAAVYDHRGSLRATWTKPRNANGGLIPGGSISLLPSKVFDNLTAYYPYGLPFADWQGDDRYLYCGKELEREFGMLTYDYHARGYNPALALFDRPDPCATKFPHVFSYLYCNANPISYTDPTGMIAEFDPSFTQEMRDRMETLFAKSSLMTFVYDYIKESPLKCLFKRNDSIISQDTKEIIGGRVISHSEGSEYAVTLELNVNCNDNFLPEEEYHVYQNIFPGRKNSEESMEFEAKTFKVAALAEADTGDALPNGNYWNNLYMDEILTKGNLDISKFSKEYIKEGTRFKESYSHFNENSPYRAPVTKVPTTLLYLLKNINNK